MLSHVAPTCPSVSDYDRHHLALYAALIDAADAGLDWANAAATIMGLEISREGAEACWRSHLERARWIVGEGLGTSLVAFNRRVTE